MKTPTKNLLAAAAVGLTALIAPLSIGHAALATPPARESGSSLASYHGTTIDLTEGWQGATACASVDDVTTCFDTEAEMDAAVGGGTTPGTRTSAASTDVVAFSSCSSSLRLYTNGNYGGSVLLLSTQGVVINLSVYGFDNVTSSYKVGACSSTFWDGSSGGGSAYPGNTSAFAQSALMLLGWDNRVSSVYIS